MSFIGNVLWFVFGGFISFFAYMFGALVMCLTVVGIPFGIQSYKLGMAILAPFGREVVAGPQSGSPLRVVFNVIWLVLFGWEIALNHLFWALVLCITIVGIPFGLQHLKLVPLAIFPFGNEFRRP